MQAQGATHVAFGLRFAQALCVQALAQSAGSGEIGRRRNEIDEAIRMLQGLSDEARRMLDSRELLSWITAVQEKLLRDAQQP